MMEDIWSDCLHEWQEVESMYSNEWYTDVKCVKCRCPGQRDESNGSVFWPAT